MTQLNADIPKGQSPGTSLFKLISTLPPEQRLRQSADTLMVLGHQLEQVVSEERLAVDMAIGTLRFSLFRMHQSRVEQLAPLCRSLVVFGEADASPPDIPGVEFVALPAGSPLAHEWFILVNSATFWGALITQLTTDSQGARRFSFDGVLTADDRLVGRAHLLLNLMLRRSMPAIGIRDHFVNRARWAKIAYTLGTHADAERLKLSTGLLSLPECAELIAARQLPADQLFAALLRILQHYAGASESVLYRLHGAELLPVAWTTASRPANLDPHRAWLGQTLTDYTPTLATISELGPERQILPTAQSVSTAPIVCNGRPWGLLLVGQAEPDPYESPTAELAYGAAALLAQILVDHHDKTLLTAPAAPMQELSRMTMPARDLAPPAPAPTPAPLHASSAPPPTTPFAPAPTPAMPTPSAPPSTFGMPNWMRTSGGSPASSPMVPEQRQLPAPPMSNLPAVVDLRPEAGWPELQKRMLTALVLYDQKTAEFVWQESCQRYSMQDICTELILPVQVAVGDGWHRGEISVAEEHFASRFVQAKLMYLLNNVPDTSTGPLAIVGCAQGELHELGAIMVALFMRWNNIRAIYLGQNIPNTTIEDAVAQLRPQILALSASTVEGAHQLIETSNLLLRMDPPRPLFLYGGIALRERPDLRARIQGQFAEGDLRLVIRELAAQLRSK